MIGESLGPTAQLDAVTKRNISTHKWEANTGLPSNNQSSTAAQYEQLLCGRHCKGFDYRLCSKVTTFNVKHIYNRVWVLKFMTFNVWDFALLLPPISMPLSQSSMTRSNKYETVQLAGQVLHPPAVAQITLSAVQPSFTNGGWLLSCSMQSDCPSIIWCILYFWYVCILLKIIFIVILNF